MFCGFGDKPQYMASGIGSNISLVNLGHPKQLQGHGPMGSLEVCGILFGGVSGLRVMLGSMNG